MVLVAAGMFAPDMRLEVVPARPEFGWFAFMPHAHLTDVPSRVSNGGTKVVHSLSMTLQIVLSCESVFPRASGRQTSIGFLVGKCMLPNHLVSK